MWDPPADDLTPILVGHDDYDDPRTLASKLKEFSELWCVTYVSDPKTILRLFRMGFKRVQIIVQQVEDLRSKIARSAKKCDIEAFEELLALMNDGALTVYGTTERVHAKLFIAENSRGVRVVVSTGNLDESGSHNHMVWFDYERTRRNPVTLGSPELPTLGSWRQKAESYERDRSPFLAELVQKVREIEPAKRPEAIRDWAVVVVGDKEEADKSGATLRVLLQGAAEAFVDRREVEIELEASVAKVIPVKARRDLGLRPSGAGSLVFTIDEYARQGTLVPKMQVLSDWSAVRILTPTEDGAEFVSKTSPPIDAQEIAAELTTVEEYLSGVDLGRTRNVALREMNKAAMFEAFLFVLSAPFFSEHEAILRKSLPDAKHKGPRFLYVAGRPDCGKSSLLEFALSHIGGDLVQGPLREKDFNVDLIEGTRALRTCFPLIFDDVTGTAFAHSKKQPYLKDYWEKDYRSGMQFPHIIVASNDHPRKEWMTARVKVLGIDVQFPKGDLRLIQRQNELHGKAKRSKLFEHFSQLYLKALKDEGSKEVPDLAGDDELVLARRVMSRLYEIAGKKTPAYIPKGPVEKEAKTGQGRWMSAIDLKLIRHENRGDTVVVHFSEELSRPEREEYVMFLAGIKHEPLRGDKLVVEDPEAFYAFVGEEVPRQKRRGLLRRVFTGQ